ncbi:MAG: beta-galactosidase, partial [Terrimicrobiaceae bacterium]
MKPKSLPFRQVHLDFHTSPHIPAIGTKFDKARWQDTLQEARVNSITLFSKCHHGWSYHPTKVGKIHPHLNFDLLRAQYDACKEIGVAAP